MLKIYNFCHQKYFFFVSEVNANCQSFLEIPCFKNRVITCRNHSIMVSGVKKFAKLSQSFISIINQTFNDVNNIAEYAKSKVSKISKIYKI